MFRFSNETALSKWMLCIIEYLGACLIMFFWSISFVTEARIFTQSSGDSNSSANWPSILLTLSLIQTEKENIVLSFCCNSRPWKNISQQFSVFYCRPWRWNSCWYVCPLTSMCCYVSWGLGRSFTSHGPICCCLTSKSSCCRAFGWSFSSSILEIEISWFLGIRSL